MRIVLLFIFLKVFLSYANGQNENKALWQGKGRIAISSDGNEHDNDDWAATPMSLALLAAKGLQDNLVLYTYSDHVWGSNQEVVDLWGRSSYEEMRISALGAKKWFGFDNSRFICAVDNPKVAYMALRDEINKSTEDNPLFIIAAGPMQVVGEALRMSNVECRKYVTVISHSHWNDNHAANPYVNTKWDNHFGWTFELMKSSFSKQKHGGTKFVKIKDQNRGKDYIGLFCKAEYFDWLKESEIRNSEAYKNGSWDWLYSRLESCLKDSKGNIYNKRIEDTYFDVSDSGMIVYLLTGSENNTPQILQEIMESPVYK